MEVPITKVRKYTLILVDWSGAPFNRWERLWAVMLIPVNIIQFIWTGKCEFCQKESDDGNSGD